jgi:hypothetical protein
VEFQSHEDGVHQDTESDEQVKQWVRHKDKNQVLDSQPRDEAVATLPHTGMVPVHQGPRLISTCALLTCSVVKDNSSRKRHFSYTTYTRSFQEMKSKLHAGRK